MQGTDGQAEQQDTNAPRMKEGHQAEQTKVEEDTITRDPETKPVRVEKSRDQAEQRSDQGRADSLKSRPARAEPG